MDFAKILNGDIELLNAMNSETQRQFENIELIASENYTSQAVMAVQGSNLTNKYAEGYVGKRYYSGCEYVDIIEGLAIERAKKLFNCNFANVQPHSGSQANQAVFLALLKPGDKILGMSLDAGGHLTHGAAPNLSGKWFETKYYGVDEKSYLIDYDQVAAIAKEFKPKLIIAGYSAYTRTIDYAKFRKIADDVGAYLLADIAHIAGLVCTGLHPDPIPHAHVVTTTTHKTLRGPRGGLILCNDEAISKKVNAGIFPGLQGGPLLHVIGAKAVAFNEALQPDFKVYIQQILTNTKALSSYLIAKKFNILTGGSDNHMLLIDLRSLGITGNDATNSLDRAGITCNKNSIPFDDKSPFITSGLRVGTPACTTRGFKEQEFEIVAELIDEVINANLNSDNLVEVERKIKIRSKELSAKFPLY